MNSSTSKLKHPFRAYALIAICLLGVATAWADPSETRSTEVSFRDLDLNTPSGAAKLYRRIQGAAQRVCGYEATLVKAQSIWQHCVLPTVDAAVAKVNNPLLTALHTGRSSPAVTAMTSK
jgi:UrcA family protein